MLVIEKNQSIIEAISLLLVNWLIGLQNSIVFDYKMIKDDAVTTIQ